jgi:AraC-like DNA-binding protein
MPASVTSVFSEPDDFQAALREEGVLSVLITGHGEFRARLTQVTLHRWRLWTSEEHLSRIALVAVPANVILVLLPISSRVASICGGIGMRAGDIMMLGPGLQVHTRTDGPCRWASLRLPAQEIARYGRALIGAGFAVPATAQLWRPPRAAIRQLRHLHATAIRAAEVRPGVLISLEAAHGLEQQLIHALLECLSGSPAAAGTRAIRQHQGIVVGFEALLQAQPHQNLRIPEICEALGVSDRTLRLCCEEQLGLSPTKYLRLRRMQLVRRALWREEPDTAKVSEVAQRYGYGFRELGRFAANYRAVFGELPSATLRYGLRPGVANLVLRRPRRLV